MLHVERMRDRRTVRKADDPPNRCATAAGATKRRNRRESVHVRAPAKVNLVLRVGPPRPDGYHELSTLMVPIDLFDDVEVHVMRGRPGGVDCHVQGRPELDGPENLAARAAELFRRRLGLHDEIYIRIVKRIPVTAGLGGGSSDAAAVLRALARVYGVRDRRLLAELGLAIGSDVPFFLGPGPAWARGRGELLRAADIQPLHLVLLFPSDSSLSIRAADAYRWLDEWRHENRVPPSKPLQMRTWSPARAVNDLQEGCFAHRPILENLVGILVGQRAAPAIMSGSGPAVFGLFASREAARRGSTGARRAIGSEIEVYVLRTMKRHPGVSRWKSPRSASSQSAKRNSKLT